MPTKLDAIILDIKKDGTCSTKLFGESQSMSKYLESISESPGPISTGNPITFRSFLEKSKHPDIIVRLVLVEDLSPTTVEVLGSALDLNPSFFSGHLVDARCRSKYSQESDLGKVSGHVKLKNHISWSWRRKVIRTTCDRSITGNLSRPSMGFSFQDGKSPCRSRDHDGRSLGTHGTVSERISFLAKNDDHCLTGI